MTIEQKRFLKTSPIPSQLWQPSGLHDLRAFKGNIQTSAKKRKKP
jgi:hypothetical protein